MNDIRHEDIRRIIRTLSACERELYVGMGGTLPAVSTTPEPTWWKPGDPIVTPSPQTVKMNKPAQVKKPMRRKVKRVRKPVLMAAGPEKSERRGRGKAA